MKKFHLGQTAAIIANIGVIAGILFLAFELHQNNELLEAHARFNHKETRANFLGEFEANPDLARIYVKAESGETLRPEEQLQLDSYRDRLFVSWEWEFFEAQSGRIEIPVSGYRSSMSEPGTRERWEERKHMFADEFVRFIEEDIVHFAE
jgi:hypothetical protein